MKRFYKQVSLAAQDAGYAVLLDDRSVRTPAGNILVLPTEPLAAAIAAEWRGQGETIIATSMPLLRLANTVIDGVATRRAEVTDAVMRFAENDLLCYRAHQPPELVARQGAGWDPWLDWARKRYGAAMAVAAGFTHVDQDPKALSALRLAVDALDPFALGALHVIASITGSLVLGLAVADGAASGAQVFQLSRIDEIYQAEKWGTDAEAAKRATALAHELDKAVELMTAARPAA